MQKVVIRAKTQIIDQKQPVYTPLHLTCTCCKTVKYFPEGGKTAVFKFKLRGNDTEWATDLQLTHHSKHACIKAVRVAKTYKQF